MNAAAAELEFHETVSKLAEVGTKLAAKEQTAWRRPENPRDPEAELEEVALMKKNIWLKHKKKRLEVAKVKPADAPSSPPPE